MSLDVYLIEGLCDKCNRGVEIPLRRYKLLLDVAEAVKILECTDPGSTTIGIREALTKLEAL